MAIAATAAPAGPAASFGFNTPFEQQLAFLRQKLNLPTDRWDDIERAAHDRAFIVAGAAKADLLADLRGAVDAAVAKGTGLEAFRKQFKTIVAARGWTGWTGEGSAAGVAWRTKVIYQTNLATSFAAGRWAQLTDPATLEGLPFWRYVHSDSVLHPRPPHQAWNGLTLAHDHPFWQSHFPPNGWGCGCSVRPERKVPAGAPTTPPEGWDQPDPRTGAPKGIDKGFDYAPGATWHPNLDKYPEPLARQVVAANLRDGVFERWVARINAAVQAELDTGAYAGMDKATVAFTLRGKLGLKESMPVAVLDEATRQLLGVQTQALKVSDYDLIKQAVSREPQYSAAQYIGVQELIDGLPFIAEQGNGRFLMVAAGRKVPLAVLHRTADKTEIYLKSFREGFGPAEIARVLKKKQTVLRELAGG